MSNKRILWRHVYYASRIFFHHKSLQNFQLQKVCTVPQIAVPAQVSVDVRKIETIWRRLNNDDSLKKELYRCYEQNEELTVYATNIIRCACNRGSCSSQMIFRILMVLNDYIRDNSIAFSPSLDQKMEVLISVLNYKDYTLVKMLFKVFKIEEQSQMLKTFIEDLIEQQKIIEAAFCASALNLQKEFPVEKILLHLLLERKMYAAVIYLTNQPELQLEAARLLDSFIDIEKKYPDVSTYANSKNAYKSLCSLMNTFKISTAHCPNLHFIRSRGAISVLVNRLIGQSISETTWEEMVMNIVGEKEELKKFLVEKLIRRNDIKTAHKMAEKFNIEVPDIPISELSDESLDSLDDDKCDNLDTSCDQDVSVDTALNCNDHLKFALKTEDVKLISTKEDFISSINEMKNYSMIGIDSEWKPHFGLSRDRLSLIQLAVHDKVFIFDVLLLSECLQSEHWDKLLDDIFGNPNIIKLGCGIMIDVNMILESVSGTKGKPVKFSHILDMSIFYQKLQEVYPGKIGCKGDMNSNIGLSSLCEIILGKPLNKEERLCDWEKRPLKESQLEYAALDAHCLLQMYDKLRETAIKRDMNFDHLAKVAIVLTTSQWRPKKRYKEKRTGKSFHINRPVPVEQLRLVMDSVFESQGKELRQLGADVVILEDVDTADTAIEISKSEGRMIICSDKLWPQVNSKVKEGICHHFPSQNAEQLKSSHFLQHFNAHVSAKSILSRCCVCNSIDGMKMSSADLKVLYELQKTNSGRIDLSIGENLHRLSCELQIFLKDISADININSIPITEKPSMSEFAFFCKKCGCIS